ncbi:Pyridoxine/pyridoxamine 5'-phosphate oxidase [Streptomyces alboniger]
MRTDLHELLRSLRVWDPEVTALPSFDPGTAPDDPLALFTDWFAAAVAAGQTEPHTMSLATADEEGLPNVRIVMLHGADADGWSFASHATSRKGGQLAERPYAALAFCSASPGPPGAGPWARHRRARPRRARRTCTPAPRARWRPPSPGGGASPSPPSTSWHAPRRTRGSGRSAAGGPGVLVDPVPPPAARGGVLPGGRTATARTAGVPKGRGGRLGQGSAVALTAGRRSSGYSESPAAKSCTPKSYTAKSLTGRYPIRWYSALLVGFARSVKSSTSSAPRVPRGPG